MRRCASVYPLRTVRIDGVSKVGRVGFIGLGKLGRPCASFMSKSVEVVGYDVLDIDVPFELAASAAAAADGADLIFIAVPTPHDSAYDGATRSSHLPARDFDYAAVVATLDAIEPVLRDGQVVVLVSTVLPGTCRDRLASCIPRARLVYNPYFIAMGTVIEDFIAPEFVPIGIGDDDDVDAAGLLEGFYRSILGPQDFVVGTWEEVECIKVFYNTFIGFKIVFANMVQDVAHRLGDTDADVVVGVLSRATRRLISPAYLKPGMGDGGPCHPRDNIALSFLAKRLGLGYDLFAAVIEARERQADNLARFAESFGLPVVVVGKAYKPEVPLIDGSACLLLADHLDPSTFVGFIDELAGEVVTVSTPSVYVLGHRGTPRLPEGFFPGSIIVDPWRETPLVPGCTVVPYGGRTR